MTPGHFQVQDLLYWVDAGLLKQSTLGPVQEIAPSRRNR
jgi:hypothetical protein